MNKTQIDDFADQIVSILNITGDGIDLDFEHISESGPDNRTA